MATIFFRQPLPAQEAEEQESHEDPAARARWRLHQRADVNGEIPPNALIKAKEQMDRLRSAVTKVRAPMDAGVSNWEWLGPGNIGGRIRSIAINPVNPQIMYVGSVGGGIWRTDNGGSVWYPLSDFMANLAVTSIVIDPTNAATLYAATGEGFGNVDAIPGAGIFKSTDAGLTWNQLVSTARKEFKYTNRLSHHPTQTNVLLAATNTGVYRTTDGGATWKDSLGGVQAYQVKYHPTDPSQALCGTATDFYLSTDGGGNWVLQTRGPVNNKLPLNPGRCEGDFARTDSSVYVNMNRNNGELWYSSNGGRTWALQNTGANYFISANNQGWYDNCIWVDPTNSSFIVVGGVTLYRSADKGVNLGQIPSLHADHHAIVAPPGYNGTTNRILYVGHDGGIETTADIVGLSQASDWTSLNNNLGITQFYGGSAAADGSLIVGGAQDNDKLHYTPVGGSQHWSPGPNTDGGYGDGGYAAVDYANFSKVYGEYTYLNISRSDNGGQTYVHKTNGLLDAGNQNLAGFVSPFSMDPNDPKTLIGGGKRIWQTSDAAENWSELRDSLSDGQLCTAIDIALGNSGVIWVGYNGGKIARTFNGGGAWFDVIAPGLPARNITDIAINPSNYSEVMVTYGGYYNDAVWMTTDGGFNWVQRTGTAPFNLPAIQVNTIRYNPLNTNWIYVGTDLGILASEDKGLTWNLTPRFASNEGPVNVEVDELFWQGTDNLIAATHGRGMFRARILGTIFVDVSNTGSADGTLLRPYRTIPAAIGASGAGSTISIAAGIYPQAPMTFSKRGRVEARNGIVQITGLAGNAVLSQPADSASEHVPPDKR